MMGIARGKAPEASRIRLRSVALTHREGLNYFFCFPFLFVGAAVTMMVLLGKERFPAASAAVTVYA